MSDTFFYTKNIEKFSLLKKIVLILSLTFICQQGYSWSLFGYDNYEDCVSKEMKGREIKQQNIVETSCIKKFPNLASFTNKNKVGELNCSFDGKTDFFPISIRKGLIKTYLGEFKVLVREEEFIRGENKDNQVFNEGPLGASIVINFYRGSGAMQRLVSDSRGINLTCHE